MERVTPQNSTPATARVQQLIQELDKVKKKKDFKEKEVERFEKEHNPIYPNRHEINTESLRFEYRRLKVLVKHLETSLYHARLFPVIHQGKLLKA